jgi:hypothetical protein
VFLVIHAYFTGGSPSKFRSLEDGTRREIKQPIKAEHPFWDGRFLQAFIVVKFMSLHCQKHCEESHGSLLPGAKKQNVSILSGTNSTLFHSMTTFCFSI